MSTASKAPKYALTGHAYSFKSSFSPVIVATGTLTVFKELIDFDLPQREEKYPAAILTGLQGLEFWGISSLSPDCRVWGSPVRLLGPWASDFMSCLSSSVEKEGC